MAGKNPTLRDIASKSGFSLATVSMILSRKENVSFSSDTVMRVEQAAAELLYQPKTSAPAAARMPKILVLCPSMINPYYATLAQGIEQTARQKGYLLVIVETYWDKRVEAQSLSFLQHDDIVGVIFCMVPTVLKVAQEINERAPLVVVGDRTSNIGIDMVELNNHEAGVLMARHLLALGHQSIAYISTGLGADHSARVCRLEGIQQTYASECPTGHVFVASKDISPETELATIDIEYQTAYELTKQMLREVDVTAFVAMNDMIAYGVMDCILDAGHQIPEDYSVAGFDNVYPSRFHALSLTTVEHAIARKGSSAMELLADKITGKYGAKEDNGRIIRIEYPSYLVPRKSTGPARRPRG